MRNFSFKAVSENDVTKVMKKMKTSHGSGCDGIASFFIKIALPLISGSLCSGSLICLCSLENFQQIGK